MGKPSLTGARGDAMKRIRLVQVGISGYGRFYLHEAERAVARGAAELAAVCLINPEEEAEACRRLRAAGTRIFSRWDEMMEAFRGEVDLCLLPVPIHLHEQMTVRALECGMNVLVEKPLGVGSGSYACIRAAEERTGRWVAVGFQDLYRPSTAEIRGDLDAGRIGAVRSITWQGLWPRPAEYFRRNNWAGKLTVDGRPVLDSPLNNAFAHYLTLAFHWAGAGRVPMALPQGVEAEISRCYPIETFDTAKIATVCDTGVVLRAAATHCCPEEYPLSITVTGDTGWMRWVNNESVEWSDGGWKEIEDWHMCLANLFAAVLDRAAGGGADIVTSVAAYPQLLFIEKLHAAAPIRDRRNWRERIVGGQTYRYLPDIEEEFAAWIAARPAKDLALAADAV